MFDLAPYNTFGLRVTARRGLIVRSIEDLRSCGDEPYLILGQGSDVLLTENFQGTALINAIAGLEVRGNVHGHEVEAGGGEGLDALIARLLRRGVTGLERLSCIPGTVGAAPVQNVGAYGAEIGEFVERIEAFNLNERQALCLERRDCAFGYRTSVFRQPRLRHMFITRVHLRFAGHNRGASERRTVEEAFAVRRHVTEQRRSKLPDPRRVGNAGSFFKNPLVSHELLAELRAHLPDLPAFAGDGGYKIPAAFLIDRAGLRGITLGNAGTWEHQALVVVNRGHAHPQEIVVLAKYIAARVRECFGVELEPEVRIFGSTGELAWQEL